MHVRDIAEQGERLLTLDPDPAPRLRILRDILNRPGDDADLAAARSGVLDSRWMTEISEEQREHGGWSRFHSMDSRSSSRIRTTEQAVARCLDVGLSTRDPVLQETVGYLEKLLGGEVPFPDPAEKNDRWPVGRELFIGSTLADIEPDNPQLEPIYARWLEIAERTFSSGRYSAEDELEAHLALTGARTMRNSYLVLDNKYAVSLLGHVQARLSGATERAFVAWLLSLPGLRYIGVPARRPPASLAGRAAGGWVRTHQILSQFRSWPRMAADEMIELAALRDEEGLWDLGPGSRLQISESWRRRSSRKIDSSVFALVLLKHWTGA